MKLKELLKLYYNSPEEVTMSSVDMVNKIHRELILPGTFKDLNEYRKTLSWNLSRDVYYREAIKENDDLYVTMTTGKMDFYFIFPGDEEFQILLEGGLKKHRSYRKEYLNLGRGDGRYVFYSRKYE